MLFVNIDHVPTVSLPLLFILIFARTLQNSTRDTICTADDHVKIACQEGASIEGRKYLYENITKVMAVVMVFKSI